VSVGSCRGSLACLKSVQPSLDGILMLGGLVGGGHHVGAEHGSPSLLPAHTLQQGLLPQVAEEALKDVALQLAQGRHKNLDSAPRS